MTEEEESKALEWGMTQKRYAAADALAQAIMSVDRLISCDPVKRRAWWCEYLSDTSGKTSLEYMSWVYKEEVKYLVPLVPHDDIKPPEPMTMEKYRRLVTAATERHPLLGEVPGIKLRGHGWELDHAIPVAKGFRDGIPPERIGDISNIWMVPQAINRAKCASDPSEFVQKHLPS